MTDSHIDVLLILLARQVRLLEMIASDDSLDTRYSAFRKDLIPRLTFAGSHHILTELER